MRKLHQKLRIRFSISENESRYPSQEGIGFCRWYLRGMISQGTASLAFRQSTGRGDPFARNLSRARLIFNSSDFRVLGGLGRQRLRKRSVITL